MLWGLSSAAHGGPVAPPAHDGWDHVAELRLDDGGIVGPADDLVVLVVLEDGRGFSHEDAPDGVVFLDADGLVLPHERVGALGADGISQHWVRLPAIPPDGELASIWLAYGGQPGPPSDPERVWAGVQGVFHLEDEAGHASVANAAQTDSELRGEIVPAGGHVGLGHIVVSRLVYSNGPDDGIPGPEGIPPLPPPFAISAWFRALPGAALDGAGLLGDNVWLGGASPWGITACEGGAQPWIGGLSSGCVGFPDGATWADGDWHEIAVVIEEDLVLLAVDGEVFWSSDPPVEVIDYVLMEATFGNVEQGRRFGGMIDEIRVWPRAVDADWLALEHRAASGAMVTLGESAIEPREDPPFRLVGGQCGCASPATGATGGWGALGALAWRRRRRGPS